MSYTLNIDASVKGEAQLQALPGTIDRITAATEKESAAAKALNGWYEGAITRLTQQKMSAAEKDKQIQALRDEYARRQQANFDKEEAAWRRSIATHEAAIRANEKLNASVNDIDKGMQRTVGSTMAASSALRVMEGAMPLRAAASFLGSLQGIGPAMQMVFPVVGAIALFEVAEKIGDKLGFHLNMWKQIADAQKISHELLKNSSQEYDSQLHKLIQIQHEIYAQTHSKEDIAKHDAGEAQFKSSVVDRQQISRLEAQINAIKALTTMGPRAASSLPMTDLEKQEAALYAVPTQGLAGRITTPGVRITSAQEAALAGLSGMQGLEAGGVVSPQQIEAGKALLPGLESALRAARQTQYTDKEQQHLDVVKAEQDRIAEQNKIDAEKVRAGTAAARKAAEEAKRQATARLSLTRRTDHWLEQQRKQHEEMLDREGHEITKESAKVSEQQFKEAMGEGKFDIARFSPHELGPLTGRETTAEFSARMGHSARMMGINADRGDEAQLAMQQAKLRLSVIDAIKDRELNILDTKRDAAKIAEINDKADLESAQTRYDLEEKIAELRKKQKQQFESEVVGLLNAGRSGGSRGLQQWGMGQLNSIEDKIVGNAAGLVWPTVQKAMGGMHANSGFLGDLLKGTPFGPDPLKTAGITLNDAGLKLITAAERLNAISASGGGGSAGGGYGSSSAAATLARIANGGGYSETDTGGGGLPTDGSSGDYGGEYGPAAAVPGQSSGGMTLGKGIGMAGAATAAGFGAYSGFKKGGARGAMSGTASVLGGAAAIAMMIPGGQLAGAILGGVSLGLGVATSLFDDPVANRQTHIAHTLQHNQYMAPVAVNASMSTGGTYSDMDRFGNVRDSNFSPFPTTQQGFFDYRNNVVIPGRTNSQFGGPGGSAAPTVVVNVSTMDSKSFSDHHAMIGEAVAKSLQLGSSPTLSETLSGRNS